MYQEDLGKLTADHLRTHIKAYLFEVSEKYEHKVQLAVPKAIEYSSVVGGTISEFKNILPQYGVDILNVNTSQDAVDLYSHEYIGQINGMVTANSRQTVDTLINRHAQAVEIFVRRHLILHNPASDHFKLIAFVGAGLEFSGAEDLGTVDDREVWVAGFSLNTSWFLSEDGPDDHA